MIVSPAGMSLSKAPPWRPSLTAGSLLWTQVTTEKADDTSAREAMVAHFAENSQTPPKGLQPSGDLHADVPGQVTHFVIGEKPENRLQPRCPQPGPSGITRLCYIEPEEYRSPFQKYPFSFLSHDLIQRD
jgi:hypothetical protein